MSLTNIKNLEVLLLDHIRWKINKYTMISLQDYFIKEIEDNNQRMHELREICKNYNYYCISGILLL